MPWKETGVMDERMRFVGRLLSGEKMAPLCREFGISRVTGHKIWNRYKQDGARGIYNRSRAPHKHPNQLPFEVEQLIVRLKREKPNWGAPKIRELVSRKYPSIKLPATSTVHCVLDRHDLVNRKRKRSKHRAVATYLSIPKEANDLWCTDFKGQFRMGNNNYCYPLTLSDFTSRFVISCEALSSTEADPCFPVFEEAFEQYGLPLAIRSDNGTPFASGNSTWNLSRLSVWWMRLGITWRGWIPMTIVLGSLRCKVIPLMELAMALPTYWTAMASGMRPATQLRIMRFTLSMQAIHTNLIFRIWLM